MGVSTTGGSISRKFNRQGSKLAGVSIRKSMSETEIFHHAIRPTPRLTHSFSTNYKTSDTPKSDKISLIDSIYSNIFTIITVTVVGQISNDS